MLSDRIRHRTSARCCFIAVVLFSFLVASSARGADSELLPLAAGGEEFGWVLLPVSEGGVRVAIVTDAHNPAGPVSNVIGLSRWPSAIGAGPTSLLLAYAAPKADGDAPVRLILRAIDASREKATGRIRFSEPRALPQLPSGLNVQNLARIDDREYGLLRESGEPMGGDWRLLVRERGAWTPVSLPAGIDSESMLQLLALSDKSAIVETMRPGNLPPRMHTLASHGDAPMWSTIELAPSAEGARLVGVRDQLCALRSEESGRMRVSLIRGRHDHDLAVLEGVPAGATPIGVGGSIIIVWREESPDRLMSAVVDVGGGVVHHGPVLAAQPISFRQVELLAVVFVSILLSIAVFLFKPSALQRDGVRLPHGAALADPPRRILAFVGDLIPAVLLAGWIWGIAPARMLEPAVVLHAPDGVRPLLTAAVILIGHSTLSEAAFGRTIGKALFRCRTVAAEGARPKFHQALIRNTVKVLCPPIALFAVLNPGLAEPWAVGTAVVIDLPPEKPEG